MNIMNTLTLRHLRLNKGRTLMTVLGIMLSVAMVCCVAGFVMSLRDVLIREYKENQGDYHVAYTDVAPDTAAKIEREGVFSSYYTKPGLEGTVSVYLRLARPGRGAAGVAEGIAQKYSVASWDVNSQLLALEGVFVQDGTMLAFVTIAAIAIAVIVIGSVVVIANAFYISSSERVRQFGLLKSAGATKGQIGRSVLFEAGVLAAVAIPAGILLGFLVQAAALGLTNGLLDGISDLNSRSLTFRVVFSPVPIYVCVAIASLTVLTSAWLPARRAAELSPVDAIRQTGDIKIRAKRLKTSRLTQKLFGFEGTLAAKSLKRSRGKYRATVVSLTVSIVLFLSMSSFIWVMNKAIEMGYGGYNFDVLVYTGGDMSALDKMGDLIGTIPNAQVQAIQWTPLQTTVPSGFATERALEQPANGDSYSLNVYPYPDDAFAKLVPAPQGEIQGILINTTGPFTRGGKVREYTPYRCGIGTKLPLLGAGGGIGSVVVGAVQSEIPDSIPSAVFPGNAVNILVPETAYRNMFASSDYSNAEYAVTTADPAAFCGSAEKLLAPYKQNVSIMNVAEQARMNRNITSVVMLFGYGFIAMLSLIAVTSVVATISTGMALRRREFAALYSAGMTPKGMNKMLHLESLMYGLKSLLIGLPVGLALSYLIYMAMGNVAVFAYQIPWDAIAISAAAVMLLTFGTMRYGRRKLGNISIVEAIRKI